MPTKRVLLALAVTLEMLSVALFLTGAQTGAAASLLVVGNTVLVVALTTGRARRRP